MYKGNVKVNRKEIDITCLTGEVTGKIVSRSVISTKGCTLRLVTVRGNCPRWCMSNFRLETLCREVWKVSDRGLIKDEGRG